MPSVYISVNIEVVIIQNLYAMSSDKEMYFPLTQCFYPLTFISMGSREKTLNSPGPVPDSKVHGAYMGPIWGQQAHDGLHVDPVNFVMWGTIDRKLRECSLPVVIKIIINLSVHLLPTPMQRFIEILLFPIDES